jgi:MFS family permease
MAWFVREKPEELATAERTTNRQPPTSNLQRQSPIVNRQSSIPAGALPSLAPVLKSPAFYLLMVGSMCSIGAVGGTMQNLKLFLSLDVKLAQGEVAQIASLVLVGSLIGRIMMGYLADRFAQEIRDAADLLHRRVRAFRCCFWRTCRWPAMALRCCLASGWAATT